MQEFVPESGDFGINILNFFLFLKEKLIWPSVSIHQLSPAQRNLQLVNLVINSNSA